jgi:periplasmic divalent cation tolerance protein
MDSMASMASMASMPSMASPAADPSPVDPGEGELVLVLTTEASQELAERLATTLLEHGLVACVSLLPIVSHYRWQGRLTRSAEVQLLLKTRPPLLEALHATVMALHSYDTPEWITLAGRTRGGYGLWCEAQGPTPAAVKTDDGQPAPPGTPGAAAPAG